MTIAVTNYVWQQGEDLDMSMIYKEGPSGAEVPLDLTPTGYVVRMDIVSPSNVRVYTFNSDTITDVDPVAAGDTPDTTEEITLFSDGTINIFVPRALTLPGGTVYAETVLGVTTFSYDIFLRRPSNRQHKIMRGTISIERSWTLWA